jgi:hypothetical protein
LLSVGVRTALEVDVHNRYLCHKWCARAK